MKTNDQNHYCPSKEELSNWYDNGGDNTIKDHLKECVPCEETVGFYKKVDETVCYLSTPPDYLASDIAEACRHLEHETLRFPIWVRLARIAAVVAVVGGVAVALRIITSPSEYSQGARVVIGGETSKKSSAGMVTSAQDKPGAVEPRTLGGLNAVPATDIRPVSIHSTNTGGTAATQTLTMLGDSVRHVWAVDNIKSARLTLLEALPNDVTKHCFSNLSDKTLTFQASMTDGELQTFVNTLQAKGWALVTKEYPQPGEVNKLSLNGHRVNYRIDLVKKMD